MLIGIFIGFTFNACKNFNNLIKKNSSFSLKENLKQYPVVETRGGPLLLTPVYKRLTIPGVINI